jgi:hypothetical protein
MAGHFPLSPWPGFCGAIAAMISSLWVGRLISTDFPSRRKAAQTGLSASGHKLPRAT